MPIYEVAEDRLIAAEETTFWAEGIYERKNMQLLLRAQIEVLDEGLMVIAEEFGGWIDSLRRIDLLCLDSDANLVVVELKRTDDGGHMELQAIRYAAMVSAMTFDQLVETYARHKSTGQQDIEAAREGILQFLGWDDVYEDQFGQGTRIILAAPDFGKELTTAVLWLNDQGIDIRCVRLKPYRLGNGPVLLDVQQLIPLPETTSFQTQIGVKRQAERQNRTMRHELRYKFWEALLDYARDHTDIHANRTPTTGGFVSGGIGRTGFALTYVARREDSQVELWISLGTGMAARNTAAFQALHAQKAEIEAEFGAELEWQGLPDAEGCRVRYVIEGGYKSPQEEWPVIHRKLTDAMIRLHGAMQDRVSRLQL